MHDNEPESPPVIDVVEIKIEIDALDDFVRALQAELDQNLQPYSTEIISDHREGVPIGQNSASIPLEALRREYYMAQQSAVDGLLSYVEATKILLRAVELMAGFYRHTDGMAAARMSDVDGAMSMAQAEFTARKLADQQAADAAEHHREMSRMYR